MNKRSIRLYHCGLFHSSGKSPEEGSLALKSSIPILLYHRIENTSVSTATPPEVFRRHLAMLKEQGWRSLSTEEFTSVMAGSAVPARSFVITFDDGYESVATAALSILKEFGFNAICFISTQSINGDRGVTPSPYLSWRQVRELQASGIIDCQSHTHTHNNFSTHSLEEIEEDLVTSVDILSYQLKLPRSHFTHLAWPWGLSNPEWRSVAAKCGFQYQYTVARQSFRLDSPFDDIPRTCFDATDFATFRRQFWLQSGQLSRLWDLAYPMSRKLRRLSAALK